MSSIADNPMIHRLSQDLLLHIFEQNAHMFADDNALITTCITSQVCQTWRYLLLATPFLWARLLDFDILARRSIGDGYWGDELVRRTGSSLLRIKARKSLAVDKDPSESPNQQLSLHFLKTIEENFHRLQILVADLDGFEYGWHHTPWDRILSLPAPQLQCFDFTVAFNRRDGRRTPVDRSSAPPISFSDDAPCLRKFRAVQFKLNFRAPWVRGLRDLYIGHVNLVLSEVLHALAATESPERLELNGHLIHWFAHDDSDEQHLPIAHLPKLKELCISFHPLLCDVLLDQLRTPPDCALKYTLSLGPGLCIDDDFSTALIDLFRRLSKFAREYFLHQLPTNLLFHYDSNLLCIVAHSQDDLGGFHVQVEHSSWFLPEEVKDAFLSEFTLAEFSHVTELRLEILYVEYMSAVSLLLFLGCFSSLQTLTTCCWDPELFKVLKEKLDPSRSVLPLLRTIKMQLPKPSRPKLIPGLEEDYKNITLSKFMDVLDGYPVEVVFSP
ncbi:hypothetical protein HYPSUDRAFT_45988 [Hypholoma sublateritium FD-334 SS-4]|uniref:F-box domain-containing protein n=1 Tax=Hypholoma sublateritium (strain FD-334 SS-4) TaxID=945553 RepID=A0A0D2NM93_HYPSF|nr:hypothetical protein HYPSUDRAFT_45988 [Hypholoma sublateritium FD-334 SS-4]